MRKLVTIRKVSQLLPIEGADRIELAKIDGWQCVVKKGEFKVGDNGFYFEIDSMLPMSDERFVFLAKGKTQPFARVKTIRLKGQLSQGLLLPMSMLTEDEAEDLAMSTGVGEYTREVDLTEFFGVKKYEVPCPMGGQQKGTFPTHLVPKTDQERIQNVPSILDGTKFRDYEVTEKLDGTSCTIWFHRDPSLAINESESQDALVGVASRNWEMSPDGGSVYNKILTDNDLVTKLVKLGHNIAIQGEIIGPSIQGNKYKQTVQEFYVFDIYDIDARKYLGSAERLGLVAQLGLKHVPVLDFFQTFHMAHIPVNQGDRDVALSLDLVLDAADGTSCLAKTPREGLVFKRKDGQVSFKAISNKFLLKNGD